MSRSNPLDLCISALQEKIVPTLLVMGYMVAIRWQYAHRYSIVFSVYAALTDCGDNAALITAPVTQKINYSGYDYRKYYFINTPGTIDTCNTMQLTVSEILHSYKDLY